MRGIAAIAVMLGHFTQPSSHHIFKAAGLAVDLFFCLSGYVLAHSYLERLRTSMSMREFLARRLIRLYPMFALGIGLGAVALLLKVGKGQTSLDVGHASLAVMLNALYLPYLGKFEIEFGMHRVGSALFPANDPAWSLFFELLVNVAFAALVARARRLHILIVAFAAMVGLVLYVKLTGQVEPGWGVRNLLGGIPRVTYGFFAGVLLRMLRSTDRGFIPVVPPGWLLLLLSVALLGYAIPHAWLLETLVLVPVLVALGSVSVCKSAWLERTCDYLGWISYPVYCLHFPVYSILTSMNGNADIGVMTLLTSVAGVIVLSHVVARTLEEPARRALSQRLLGSAA